MASKRRRCVAPDGPVGAKEVFLSKIGDLSQQIEDGYNLPGLSCGPRLSKALYEEERSSRAQASASLIQHRLGRMSDEGCKCFQQHDAA